MSAPTTAPPSSRCVASSSPGFDPERQGHVQIARRAPQQEVDQLHRAARQAVDLVEHEQARPLVTLDCAGQHSHLLHRRRRDPSVVRAQKIGIQSRVLERVRQIAAEQVGRIVVVQRDPGDDYPLLHPAPDHIRKHRRLAESGGCLQHRQPPFQHPIEAPQQRCTADVSCGKLRRQHLLLQQPGTRRSAPRRQDCPTCGHRTSPWMAGGT